MPDALLAASSPFVGRDEEMGRLRQHLKAAMQARKPQFVLVNGDYGMGKTTLVEHFLEEVGQGLSAPLIGRGTCKMETEKNGLVPFTQFLDSLMVASGTLDRSKIGATVEMFKKVAPAWIDIFTNGAASAVMTTLEEGGKLLGHASFTRDDVFAQFANALAQIVKKQPVVAFIEDLHWADVSSLHLLFYLIRTLRDLPGVAFLFIGTHRPVVTQSAERETVFKEVRANLIRYGATEIELNAGIDVGQYVAQRYWFNDFPPRLIERVTKQTTGHPLFVSQLFFAWEDSGVIERTGSADGIRTWRVTRDIDAEFLIPESLSEVLGERLRLMDDCLRDALICGAVEGDEFTAQVVARLRQMDEIEAIDCLHAVKQRFCLIEEAGVCEPGPSVLDLYRFVHRFFRDYIYQELPSGKRRILHRQVGEALEAFYAEPSAIADKLATHFELGRLPVKAARYAHVAARCQQARYMWDEGERWCEFGLAQLGQAAHSAEGDLVHLDLLETYAFGSYVSGEYGSADRRYKAAFGLARQLAVSPERQAQMCAVLADVGEYLNQYDDVLKYAELGSLIVNEHAAPLSELHLRLEWLRGYLQFRRGENQKAIEDFRRVIALGETLGDQPSVKLLRARVHNSLANALTDTGHFDEALDEYRQAIGIAENLDEQVWISGFLLNVACMYLQLDDLDQCLAYVQRGREVALRTGETDDLAHANAVEGEVLLRRGKACEAEIKLAEALRLSEEAGSKWNLGHIRACTALAYLAQARLPAAEAEIAAALAYLPEGNAYLMEVGFACMARGRIEAARGALDAANVDFQSAIAIHDRAGQQDHGARARWHYAIEVLLPRGETASARQILGEAVATFQALGLQREAEGAQVRLQALAAL